MVLDGKSLKEYSVNAGVPQGLVLHFSYYALMTLLMLFLILLSMWMILPSTLSVQASGLWQQIELASELKSDLRNIQDWHRKWLVDFNAGETQLVLSGQSNNTGAIDVKMDACALEEKSSSKMMGLSFSSLLFSFSPLLSLSLLG